MNVRPNCLVRNYIWVGKVDKMRVKIKWDFITFPIYKGGLGIIDPKAQVEALLAKLVVHGLMSRTKPWKDLFKRRMNMLQLQGKTCFVMPPNISWLFSEK